MKQSFRDKVVSRCIVFVFTLLERSTGFLGPKLARRFAVMVKRNLEIPTWDQQTTRVDVYTPKANPPQNGWPVAIMIHGGGFRFFSKDSHAPIAAWIAANGYLTLSVDYRLVPKHSYPDGIVDVLSVYEWVMMNAKAYGGDSTQIVLAGESAGANLALVTALVATHVSVAPKYAEKQKSIAWIVPQKLMLHCGYHQVSGVDTLRDLSRIPKLIADRLRLIEKNYLKRCETKLTEEEWKLADPLLILEAKAKLGEELPANFPEVFIPVGETDPVVGDSIRLSQSLQVLGVQSTLKIYPKAPHAFFSMPWHKQFRIIWKDIRSFLALPTA